MADLQPDHGGIPDNAARLTRAATLNESLAATLRAVGVVPDEVAPRGEDESDEQILDRVLTCLESNQAKVAAHLGV